MREARSLYLVQSLTLTYPAFSGHDFMKAKKTTTKMDKAMPKMTMAQHKKMMGKGEEKGEYGKKGKKMC